MGETWDDIVVGAGTAGAVVAARLSEEPSRRVLLLEAGPDFPRADDLPRELRDAHSAVTTGFNWDLRAHIQATSLLQQFVESVGVLAASGARHVLSAARAAFHAPHATHNALQQQPYFPGKVVGGTSAINGAVALRGLPDDFERWVPFAGEEWAWREVLPRYVKLEHDRTFAGPAHGQVGPVAITHPSREEVHPLQAAFWEACLRAGLPEIADLNDLREVAATGVGPAPTNSVRNQRVSTATAYLAPARSRGNLEIRGGCEVHRVLFEQGRAVGLEFAQGGARTVVFGRRITLGAGTLHTPAILLRSGIGAERLLRSLGLSPVAPLAGVGENLIEHPAVMMWMVPKPGVCQEGEPYHQVLARAASRPGGRPDLTLFMLSNMVTSKIPLLGDLLRAPLAGAISVMLASPDSRGRVFLDSPAPGAKPVIELNLCDEPRDLERLMAGVRLAWQVAKQPALTSRIASTFLWNEAIVRNDELLKRAIQRFINGAWHPVGTARMGPATDPGAVVDPHCRVHGVRGLRVVDASAMPAIPSGPTGLTCMMLGERVAEWMAAEAE